MFQNQLNIFLRFIITVEKTTLHINVTHFVSEMARFNVTIQVFGDFFFFYWIKVQRC